MQTSSKMGVSNNGRSQMMLKRIGTTTYMVKVRFSTKETMGDKLLRLIESEVRKNA